MFYSPLSIRRPHSRNHKRRPAITLLPPNEPVLWGITYRLTVQLLEILGFSLPPDPD